MYIRVFHMNSPNISLGFVNIEPVNGKIIEANIDRLCLWSYLHLPST